MNIMKRIKFIITTLILGLFVAINPGYTSTHDQERQEQERQDRQGQEQERQDLPEGDDRTMEIDGLPQTVRDTLKSEYGDWIPVEASLESDPEQGTVYRVKLHDAGNEEAKIVTMTRLGEIIEEEDAEIRDDEDEYDRDLQRGRQESEGTEEQQDHGERNREQHMHHGENHHGQHMQQHEHGQRGAMDQARSLDPDNLPEEIQETLREDYADWRPSEAFMVTDPEEGTVYRVKIEKTEEEESRILKITHDGEVLDEEEVGAGEEEDERRHERQY
jgi:hypothetical protein